MPAVDPGEAFQSDQHVGEQLVSPQGQELLKAMSDAYARSDGYRVEFTLNPKASTFSTSCELGEVGKITVGLSPELLKRAEAENRLELLGFAVMHETGHVERFQGRPAPKTQESAKDNYFGNVVDDIAINYSRAKRTRLFHDMTARVYDDYLYPVDRRSILAEKPRHQQFMDSLLVLAMTTDAHARSDTASLLEEANITGLDDEVMAALDDVLAHEQDGRSFNLLDQLRAYGSDLRYADRVTSIIRPHYDALYEEDKSDRSKKPSDKKGGDGQGDGQQGSGESSDEDQPFDYSDSAACGHSHSHEDDKPDDSTDKAPDAKEPTDANSNEDGSDGQPLDIDTIAKDIADKIQETVEEAKADPRQNKYDLTPEQMEKLRQELDLNEDDFAGYMATRQKYGAEIRAIEEMLLQLRHERHNEFLAPGREVAARGHRINIPQLIRAIASVSLNDQPDIWKHPRMAERVEHEFEGLDMYLVCDTSASMAGTKAEAAASSGVVLEEGLLGASAQMAGEHAPVVRLQVQAFGAGHQILCKLTDSPTPKDLGRTYAALKNPASNETRVSGALKAIKPEAGRLSVVIVVSDGQFHDSTAAEKAGQALSDQNAAIIQFVYGNAEVSKLADNAHLGRLKTARDLPEQVLGMLPELVELIRRDGQV